ncbi:MAG: FAD-dependent oxidoreductase, partial [Pseudomonadota bacterium]
MTSTIQAGVFSDAPVMQEERLPPFLRITLRRWTKWYVGGSELFWPFTDATIRFFVALWFLRSGLVKAADWDTALLLAESEYPISWMSAYNAAVTGLAIELIAPILLILGLFTRPAALAMGALTIVSQAVYIPTTTNLIVIAILFWYLVHGPAALSIDRAVSSGMKQSALPLARPIVLAGEWLRNSSAPFVMAVIRFWLAVSLLAYAHVIDPPIIARTWLPITIFSGFPDWLALLSAGLLILGIAAGLVSYALFFLIGFFMIAGAHPNVTFFPFLLLAIYEAKGAGMMSADGFIWRWLERNVLFDREYADIPESWPHIVVVGAGFGGLAAVARLKRLPVRITLIDKRNYHLFQPLLYQIATATLNPSDIATPIRSLFGSDGNVRVLKGEVMGIDKDGQNVSLANGEVIAFDKLLIATGATHCYFGKDQWSEHAPGLKTIEDGVAVRGTILNAFEKAEASDDPERIKRLLTFVVVGAGPTGVELAGAIAELAKINVA